MVRDTFEGLQATTTDFTVIGAGPVRLALALELDRLGRSVTVLEAGGRVRDRSVQSLSSAEIVSPETHDEMAAACARMLGGTSNLWAGACVPYDPIDFYRREFVPEVKWPLAYHELLPFYETACRYLDTGPAVFSVPDVVFPLEDQFTMRNLARFANERRAQVVHAEALAKSKRVDIRLNTVVVDVALSDNGRADSIDVVKPDGSQRTRLNVRTLVIAAGGLETTRLMLNMQRKRGALFCGEHGPLGRFYMGHLTGIIADVTFADRAYADLFDFQYDDRSSSYFRRRFQPSAAAQLKEGVLNTSLWPEGPISDPRHGSAVLSMLYLTMAANQYGRMLLPEVIQRRHGPENPRDIKGHLRNLRLLRTRSFLEAASVLSNRFLTKQPAPGFFVRNKRDSYGLSYHSEHLPHLDSRVTLSRNCDRLEVNQLRIDLRFKADDAESVIKTHDLFAQWLTRSGLGSLRFRHEGENLVAAVLNQARHGTHQLGTTRMGSSPPEGPINNNLRSFDITNLYVCSSSILPTSSQANPTLTVVAFAVRLARHLAERAH